MMDFISMVLTFIKGHTKLVIIAVLSLALLWGAFEVKGWYDYQIQQAYSRGVNDTDNKWDLQMRNNKDANQDFKNGQQDFSDELSRQLAEEKAKNELLRSRLDEKQEAYNKSEAGKKFGLDNDFVDIYNESLGVK
ncbi:Rz-like spanin [Klebsiella phage KpS8]|jgi:hypothetical protein|uniref:I-spanin n=4 Tax=Mydovirus TaxID=2842888 RepID=A0A3G8F0W4_9CAUD|nr:Rz-like spanin [Klebsiella phage vB_KpnM_KB57]YP_009842402.1 Rz-like spanin [Proteus phage Mydo]YP_009859124.1 Rz-like spanin [Klebsiella phage KpS8]QKE60508.1 hypothetical protein KPP_1781 [Klebsiella phage KPP-1]QOI68653.1 hypothetical protein phage621_00076 [Klebsiella phage vB_KpnM_Seu621]UKS71426.1 hypothetical protein VIK251_00076 [Klebsiella phage vB_KpnM_VIK251]UVX30021.1 Rz-like spanin [Klebsiella phage VLCpiM5a]ALM02640.1 hypothetical protein KB57_078 [Klebsiella phage vB_KpnM_K